MQIKHSKKLESLPPFDPSLYHYRFPMGTKSDIKCPEIAWLRGLFGVSAIKKTEAFWQSDFYGAFLPVSSLFKEKPRNAVWPSQLSRSQRTKSFECVLFFADKIVSLIASRHPSFLLRHPLHLHLELV